MIFTKYRRLNSGTTMAEMPLALWILILGIAFPLIIMIMMTVKFGFFWNAARDACKQAVQAQTFSGAPPQGGLSAIDTAENVATSAASMFSGITLLPGADGRMAQVRILKTDLISGTTTTLALNQRLTGGDAPPDPDQFYYAVQVVLEGQIEPFMNHPGVDLSGAPVPGLTVPFRVSVSSQFPFENIQGLDD